jgi:hypothetical protein
MSTPGLSWMITSTARSGPAEATRAGGLEAPSRAAGAAGRVPALGPSTTSQASAAESSPIAESVAAVSAGRRALCLDEKRGTAAQGIAATHTKR